jgi:magnesium chelatase family protein
MLSKVLSSAVHGIDAYIVEVETHMESSIPSFTIVGLPDSAIKESKERVISAIKNSGYRFLYNRRITINLALRPYTISLEEIFDQQYSYPVDFQDVRGREHVKRALEVAAAGGHNIIMIGPPGSGKTMLAKRFPTILPAMTLAEALETTKIHSVAGELNTGSALVATRPFRSPHHTVSEPALV